MINTSESINNSDRHSRLVKYRMSEEENKTEQLEQVVHEIMFQLVSVLNSYGITDVRAGNLMRLMGTPEDECAMFDDKVMFISGDYLDMRDVIPGEQEVELTTDDKKKLH